MFRSVVNIDALGNIVIGALDTDFATLTSKFIVFGIFTVGITLIEATWATP